MIGMIFAGHFLRQQKKEHFVEYAECLWPQPSTMSRDCGQSDAATCAQYYEHEKCLWSYNFDAYYFMHEILPTDWGHSLGYFLTFVIAYSVKAGTKKR